MFAYSASDATLRHRRARLLAGCAIAAALASPALGQRGFDAAPTIVTGAAEITQGIPIAGGLQDQVMVNTPQVVINWVPTDTGTGGGPIAILPSGNVLNFYNNADIGVGEYTVLNRILPNDPSRAVQFDGLVQSDVFFGQGVERGNIWFYSPGGIIAGATSRFDVGGLVLSANDIDTSGGLFGTGTDAQRGTIRFRGVTDSRSFVTVQPGAQVNAAGSYVALVAPRVKQSGSISVNGSAALVAAESVDITIPVSGGLFDIFVSTGSNVDAGGETTLDHDGTTAIADPSLSGEQRRVYMVAMPKNDAVTMLVTGNVGYDAASQVVAENGAILLTTGRGVSAFDTLYTGGPQGGNTRITGGEFANRTSAYGSASVTADTSVAALNVSGDLSLESGAGLLSLRAQDGRDVSINGRITLRHNSPDLSGASAMLVQADTGSTISASFLALDSFTSGENENGYGVLATAATGGTIDIIANGGIITAGTAITATTSARGGAGSSAPSANGSGGRIRLTATNGGLITSNEGIDLSANGFGGENGYGGANGGAGTGGAITVLANGGTIETNGLDIEAFGIGGSGPNGGNGAGGTAQLTFTAGEGALPGGLINLNGGQISIDVNGSGGNGGQLDGQGIPLPGTRAGEGQGGTALLSLTGGTLDMGLLEVRASGDGGNSNDFFGSVESGGSATGGNVTVEFNGTTAPGENSMSISADGRGGEGAISGSATGGTVRIAASGGTTLLSGGMVVSADGFASDATLTGGAGTGGSITLEAGGGTIDASFFQFNATGEGGRVFDLSGVSGDGAGGTITLTSAAGGTIRGSGDFDASGEGGRGSSDADAGNGQGGIISILAAGGAFDFAGSSTNFVADGIGGASRRALGTTGRGGVIDLQLDGGAGSRFDFSLLTLRADGSIAEISDGGVEPSSGGTGIGGTVRVAVNGGALAGDALALSATGTGGVGGEGLVAGSGHQGLASLSIAAGSVTLTEGIEVRAEAFGGVAPDQFSDPAAGSGGTAGIGANPFGAGAGAYVSLTGGSLTTPALLLSADSRGGDGGSNFTGLPTDAGAGGDARGGVAVFTTSGDASLDAGTLSLSANGVGGDGGSVEYGYGASIATANGGQGGAGSGGIATAQLASTGAASLSFAAVGANGEGGQGGDVRSDFGLTLFGDVRGGAGGDGTGGEATLSLSSSISGSLSAFVSAHGEGSGGGGGPIGGSGGNAQGGTALIDITGGDTEFSQIAIGAAGFGGGGGEGMTSDGGNGGSARGGNANIRISGVATSAITNTLDVDAGSWGGAGGFGGSDPRTDGVGGDGGRGGAAIGGLAALNMLGGAFSVDGIESSARFTANANGGVGGGGGTGGPSLFVAGAGGPGGDGSAGSVRLESSGGQLSISNTIMTADGLGGGGGSAGDGGGVISDGGGFGGNILVSAEGGSGVSARLGETTLSADGVTFTGLGATQAGQIEIASTATNPVGALGFDSLDAHALGDFFDAERGAAILTRASGGPIIVTRSAQYDARGAIAFSFEGAGGLQAGDSVTIFSSDSIGIQHTNLGGGTRAASISAGSIRADAIGDVFADQGSLLQSRGGIDLRALVGSIDFAAADAAGDVIARALGNVTAGSIRATNAVLSAGQVDSDSSPVPGQDVRVTGAVTLAGNADIRGTRDAIIAPGAQIVADRAITIASGDDIIIGAGALVRAANNPPPETGYGLSDPLQQASQLRLLAGSIDTGGLAPGEVASILIDGAVESPNRTLFMSAGAVAGSPASQLTSGNLYVRLFDIPAGDQVPLNDGGQLTGACLQGSVCLGAANVDGIVRIGESGFEPINLRLGGRIDATDVLLRARSIELGQAGTSTIIAASQRLTIESTVEDLVLNGALTVTGGASTARIASARDIVGAEATLAAPGTLDLYAADNITLAGIDAATIRTVGFDGAVLNASGITLPGTATIGRLATTGTVRVDAANGIAIDTLTTDGAAILTAALGSVVVSTDAATAGISATGRSVSLTGADGLNVTSATATDGDVLLATTAGDLAAGSVTASGAIGFDSAGAIDFDTANAGAALVMTAGGNVTSSSGGSGASVSITTPGSVDIAQSLVATSGALSIDAAAGIRAAGLVSAGTMTLTSSNGAIDAGQAAATGIVANGRSIRLANGGGLNVDSATATDGGITLTAGEGVLNAGFVTATEDVRLTGQSGVTFGSVDAGGQLTMVSGGAITGGTASASEIFADTPNTLTADRLVATTGRLHIDAGTGIALRSFSSAGAADLSAANGAIEVADAQAAGGLSATARSITLTSDSSLNIDSATATDGDVVLGSGGDMTLGQVGAANRLAATAGGSITVDGAATGADIAFTSRDLAIGATGRIGNSQTRSITLTSTADRLFLGDAPGSGYRIDNDEFSRIRTGGDLTIVSAPGDFRGDAFDLIDPAATNVVIGAMTFDGAQLGSTGTFRLVTPRSIGIVGAVQYRNFGSGQTVTYAATGDIALAAETGSVTVKDSAGGLAGTLRLEAQQVHAMSRAARGEIPNLTLDGVRQRLGTNDQVENDGGYFQAGTIVVRIGRLAFIQNSGGNSTDPNQKRGFTANNLILESVGSAPAQVVINGKVGSSTGESVIPALQTVGSFDPGSAFNGCLPGLGCSVPAGPQFEQVRPALSSPRDQVRSEEEEDEKEEALQAAQTRPDPVIQMVDVPPSRFEPLIDEPVTGAGNEDLWEPMTPTGPTP